MESILYMIYENNYYWHEGTDPKFCRLYGKNKVIHKVKVTEDQTGKSNYFGAWDYTRNRFINIWPNRISTVMCYPYGIEVEEQKGNIKLYRVNIDCLEVV